MTHNSILPQKFKIFSSSWLKVIATAIMLIDHIAGAFLADVPIVLFSFAGRNLTLYLLMKIIGRLSFPVFSFLIIEGFRYTRSRKKYGIRLFLFALISELPWNLEHSGALFYEKQNVFFTLFFGYLALCVIERFREKLPLQLLFLLILIVVAYFFKADYGMTGVGLIIAFYCLRESPVVRMIVGLCLIPNHLLCTHAFVLIEMYNGKRGFIKGAFSKYIFYLIYPVHLLIIYFVKYICFA